MYPGCRAQDELPFPPAGEATSTTALSPSFLHKMGQAARGWLLPSCVVENLAPAAHVQLSALGGESDSPKATIV